MHVQCNMLCTRVFCNVSNCFCYTYFFAIREHNQNKTPDTITIILYYVVCYELAPSRFTLDYCTLFSRVCVKKKQ